MGNNYTITKEDLEKYKDKIEYWKELRKVLTEYKDTMTKEQLATFTNADKDILNPLTTDEEICIKAKKVYEFTPTVNPDDSKIYKNIINIIRSEYGESFSSDEHIILTIKTYLNEVKKNLFEENIKTHWDEYDISFKERLYEEAESNGWYVYE